MRARRAARAAAAAAAAARGGGGVQREVGLAVELLEHLGGVGVLAVLGEPQHLLELPARLLEPPELREHLRHPVVALAKVGQALDRRARVHERRLVLAELEVAQGAVAQQVDLELGLRVGRRQRLRVERDRALVHARAERDRARLLDAL